MTFRLDVAVCVFAVLLALPASAIAKDRIQQGFHDAREVQINDLPPGTGGSPISTEEPFLSRDGRFLFFNTGHKEGNKDLHWAKRLNGQWVYQGEIGPAINTPKEVQGNPTMDSANRFYFIDTTASHMARGGIFHPESGLVDGLYELDFLPDRDVRLFKQRFTGNMGVEVSADGKTMYFSRATWDLNLWFPGEILASNILLAQLTDKHFVYDEKSSKRLMRLINSDELEYAACISRNGLELFFTRLSRESFRNGHPQSMIMRATRPSRDVPFGRPVEIHAIGHNDFVEGPSLSADEHELYYHKHVGKKFRLFRVKR